MASQHVRPNRFGIIRHNGVRPSARRTSKLLKGLLFLFIAAFGLIGIRLLPSVRSEGWRPTLSLMFALVLITIASIREVRSR